MPELIIQALGILLTILGIIFAFVTFRRKKREAEMELLVKSKKKKQKIEKVQTIIYCAKLAREFALEEGKGVSAKHVRRASRFYTDNAKLLGHSPKLFPGFFKAVKSHARKDYNNGVEA
ncbi:hypothetical protein [Vibrio phage vB_VmeM-Yong XC32]|nr:hypothetical protein [Vibrio phage vB_VmeM-Yong XC31]QAX96394.1 hypothetical protein [Vibrio phage vB_VmeM-Yong XC32]